MKQIKWKFLIISSLICLLPIVFGIAVWNDLPESIAIHFDINNTPDNFASKPFAVFAMPFMMAALQIFCCIMTDINTRKHGECKKFENVAKWIIPVIAVIVQTMTLVYSLGVNVDIRRVAIFVVGIMFIAIGNYLPKLNYIKNYKTTPEKAKKITRLVGYEYFFMGIIALITLFMPPIASVIWLILLIPCTVTSIIYTIILNRKK